jgi:hypothetical protein
VIKIVWLVTVLVFVAPTPLLVALSSATPRIRSSDDDAPSPSMTREEFAKRVSKVCLRDSMEKVALLLAMPDEIRYQLSSDPAEPSEVWCYGTEGPGSFPALGRCTSAPMVHTGR